MELQQFITNEYFPDLQLYTADQASQTVIGALKDGVKPAIGSLCLLLGLVFAAALIRSFSSALCEENAPLDLCVSLLCSAAVYEALKRSYDAVIMSLSGMAVLMDAMSAAMCAVYGLTGNVAGGSASVTTLMFVLQAVRLVSDKILLPLIFACFGCSVLSASGFGDGLSGIPATVKRAVTFLCGASAAVVCAVLSYQTVIAKAADSAVLKTVKFASSSFLPIVGSSLSESVNAVSSAIGAIKTASGVGGVISLVVLTVPAAVSVASSVFCVKLCSFLCGILQTEKLKAFFDDCGELLSMLLAVQLTVSVIFAASCALFCI
ncbi:MAG: hypothetical protein J5879_07820 [Clostridia bacterium]|nr:hypothetical protein [Clostridia bacterium]